MRLICFYLFLPIIFALTSGCNLVNDVFDKEPAFNVDEVNIIEKNGNSVLFEVNSHCASFCIKNPDFKVQISENRVQLLPVAEPRNPNASLCPDACLTFTKEVRVTVPSFGTYRFEFLGSWELKTLNVTF